MMAASTPGLPPMRAVWVVRERRSLAPRTMQDGGGEVGELGMGSVLLPREVLHADEGRRSLRVVVQKGAKAVGAASAPVARVAEGQPAVGVCLVDPGGEVFLLRRLRSALVAERAACPEEGEEQEKRAHIRLDASDLPTGVAGEPCRQADEIAADQEGPEGDQNGCGAHAHDAPAAA